MILTNLKKRILTSIILLSLIYLMFNYDEILALCLIIIGVISLLEFFEMIRKIIKSKFNQLIINSFFIIYISFFCIVFFLLLNFLYLKILILSLLLTCIASDIGGFVFGKIFKGPKLTNISPNKTISGALGSILFSCIIFVTLIYTFTDKFSFKILIIGISTSIFCQVGDLFFSLIKRKAKVKDTGNILPGHGGILDRIDGILFGIPFGFLSINILF